MHLWCASDHDTSLFDYITVTSLHAISPPPLLISPMLLTYFYCCPGLKQFKSQLKEDTADWLRGTNVCPVGHRQLKLAIPLVTIRGKGGCQVEMRSHMGYRPATGPWLRLMVTNSRTHIHTYAKELAAERNALIQHSGNGSLSEWSCTTELCTDVTTTELAGFGVTSSVLEIQIQANNNNANKVFKTIKVSWCELNS